MRCLLETEQMPSDGRENSSAPPSSKTDENPTKTITSKFSLNLPIMHFQVVIST